MSRSRPTQTLFLVLALATCATCATWFGGPNDLDKMRAELAKIDSKIEAELTKIEKKYRGPLEKQYTLLTADAVFRDQLGKRFEELAKAEASTIVALQDKSPSRGDRRKLEKAVDALLDDQIGRNLSSFFREAATNYVVELYEPESGVAGSDVIEGMTLDFEGVSFEDFFAKHRSECFSALGRLEAKRAELSSEITKLEEIEEAAKAGIPAGMVRVPAGEYTIGIDEKQIKELGKILGYGNNPESLIRMYYSTPALKKELNEYFIDRSEVTSEWYALFLRDLPEVTDQHIPMLWEKAADKINKENGLEEDDEGYVRWAIPEGYKNRPVTGIFPEHAMQCANWMGRRLPTEFEWEAAARFGAQKRGSPNFFWPWGDDWDLSTVTERANADPSHEHKDRIGLAAGQPPVIPVGSFEKGLSTLGLRDVAGNATEMTTSPYEPYPGFKGKRIGRANANSGEFLEDHIVLRGGDCLKRDIMVTTVSRLYLNANERATLVGFRTAASAVRGQDEIAWMQRDGFISRFLSDVKPLPKDVQHGRPTGRFATEDPERFSAITRGGVDPETGIPSRAEHILAINRDTAEIRNMNTLRALAREDMVCLGMLRVDVPIEEPKLAPGTYFVYWQNEYLPEPEAATGDEGEGEGEAEGEEKPKKGKGKGKDKQDAEEIQPVPEALVFVLKSTETVASAVRMEKGSFIEPVLADTMPTRLMKNESRDTVEVIYSFPTSNRRKNFVVSFNLKLEAGKVAEFR